MQIKCENCSIVYEVSEKHFNIRHPRFFKCTSCGYVFNAPIHIDISNNATQIPPVEQTDSVPMALSEIFQNQVEEMPSIEERKEMDGQQANFPSAFHLEEEKKNEMTPELFTPFDKADEFTPIEVNKDNRLKKFLTVLLVSIVILSAMFYILYNGRYYFTRQAKVPQEIYNKMGIDTSVVGDGLAFQNTKFDVVENLGMYTLNVKSHVANIMDFEQELPPIVIYLKDENGRIIQTSSVQVEKISLQGGEVLPFEASLDALTENARQIEITFERENK